MDKIVIKSKTKSELCDHALAHFGVTINRKKPLTYVVTKFKAAEKEYLRDLKLGEEQKAADTKKRQEDAAKIAKKEADTGDKVHYPVKIKDKEGETVMHRPSPGGLALGDPVNRDVEDGVAKTDSAPHLDTP
ncbi:hypothetical protein KAR91_20815 [Candidatus Pacearchaeota archaeon]|nr:hypothetical protein [Candidatus Pacearchaeota archaeon]